MKIRSKRTRLRKPRSRKRNHKTLRLKEPH
jgi:hypothetical protein